MNGLMKTLSIHIILIFQSSSNAFLNVLLRKEVLHYRSICKSSKESSLPDSLDDAAKIASKSCLVYFEDIGSISPSRCRVDFDTTIGDETFSRLKSSTEFMQKFVTYLCCTIIPDVLEQRQREIQTCMKVRNDLLNNDELSEEERDELSNILSMGGRRDTDDKWEGGKARIYFPDEGSAALAKRDWVKPDTASGFGVSFVPSCVEFSSLSGQQDIYDTTKDMLIFFFCPEAAESKKLEDILYESEASCSKLKLSVLVNPNLVDMGVTGYGLAGRLLRERLIDPLTRAYYLRSLSWGAMTRIYPNDFTIWQEDENEDSGYRCIKALKQYPSNPQVEDIYDMANSENNNDSINSGNIGGGILDMIGDFVDGMTKL